MILLLGFSISILSFQNCSRGFNLPESTSPSALNNEESKIECPANQNDTDSVTIQGLAQFKIRATKQRKLGDPGNPQPIQEVDVRIVDENGQVIRCGETDLTGQFILQIPKKDGKFLVRVFSQSANALVNAGVFKNALLEPYYLEQLVSISGGISSSEKLSLMAEADENLDPEVKGGAFHILDIIRRNNYWAKDHFGYHPADYMRVHAFWQIGQDPESIRTAIPEIKRPDSVFILGGKDGDFKAKDTDHFDAAVISSIHLKTILQTRLQLLSGNSVDEANGLLTWALLKYFQTEVLGSNKYDDTYGVDTYNSYHDKLMSIDFSDITPGYHIEGIIPGKFENNLSSLSRFFYGFRVLLNISLSKIIQDTSYRNNPFKTPTNFVKMIQEKAKKETPYLWNQWYGLSEIKTNSIFLGANLVSSGQACPQHGAISESGLEYTSFVLFFDGNPSTLSLSYSKPWFSTENIDLDLFVFDRNFDFINYHNYKIAPSEFEKYVSITKLLKWSIDTYGQNENGLEEVSLTGLPKGYYLINIPSKSGNYTGSVFQLSLNSQFLCPEQVSN